MTDGHTVSEPPASYYDPAPVGKGAISNQHSPSSVCSSVWCRIYWL